MWYTGTLKASPVQQTSMCTTSYLLQWFRGRKKKKQKKKTPTMNPEKGWHQMDARFCTIVQYRCRAWWGRLRRTAGGVEAGDEHVSKIADVQSNLLEQGRGKKAAWGKRRKKKNIESTSNYNFLKLPKCLLCFSSKKKKKKKKSPYSCRVHCRKKHLTTTASASAFKTAVQRWCWSEINV